MRTSLPLLCAAALAVLSCSSDGTEVPRPSSVEPATGLSTQSTRVIIRGDGFLAIPSEQQSGGGATVDARHRAWLDDAELDVTWIDPHTLEAIVPAGLSPGPKRLLVENALGERGLLENAFTVIRSGNLTLTPAQLTAALAVEGSPTVVLVGQALNVTLTVNDTGETGATVSGVTPSVSPEGAATCGAPSPAPPQAISGLGSVTFTWICTAQTAGDLTLGAAVAGASASGGAALQATAPGVALSVQLPAELTATIAADRSTANLGQPVTATFTVTNGGSATANVTAVTPSTSGSAAATCGAVSPDPAPIAAGAARAFTWTCTPITAGTLVLSGTAEGTDAVSGAAISATPATPASVTVQTPAALSATLAAAQVSVPVGEPVAMTLSLVNQGEAAANVTAVTIPAVTGATCLPPSFVPPQSVPGGGSLQVGWTCTADATGTVTLSATVAAQDANTGANVSPPVLPVEVTWVSTLSATLTASTSTVVVDAPVALTLELQNTGLLATTVTAVSPTRSGPIDCTAATPVPQEVAAGTTGTFTWTCTPRDDRPYTLSAAVSTSPAQVVTVNSVTLTPSGAALPP